MEFLGMHWWYYVSLALLWCSGVGMGWVVRLHRSRHYTLADLGPMLRKQRAKRGITQRQAGEEAGLKRAAFGSFERGTEPHSIEDLDNLARCLGLRGRDFL